MRLIDILNQMTNNFTEEASRFSFANNYLPGGDYQLRQNTIAELVEQDRLPELLEQTLARKSHWQDKVNKSTSDYSYWGYVSMVQYWLIMVNLTRAAIAIGKDNLPEIPFNTEQIHIEPGIMRGYEGLIEWTGVVMKAAGVPEEEQPQED